MANLIVIVVLLIIVGAAAAHVVKAKKQGQKCIGCPCAKECASNGCGCGNTGGR